MYPYPLHFHWWHELDWGQAVSRKVKDSSGRCFVPKRQWRSWWSGSSETAVELIPQDHRSMLVPHCTQDAIRCSFFGQGEASVSCDCPGVFSRWREKSWDKHLQTKARVDLYVWVRMASGGRWVEGGRTAVTTPKLYRRPKVLRLCSAYLQVWELHGRRECASNEMMVFW